MNKLILPIVTLALLVGGCANPNQPTYNSSSYNEIKTLKYGTVLSERAVTIKDSGAGTFLGAGIGAILGSLVGKGAGNTLATLGGGLAGAYAGDKINEANAEELTVELNSGERVVIIAKGNSYMRGDRVEIITDGNRVASVKRVPQ
ncbi:MAG: glycine zipper 2TM domain-containing protein [Helicobacteraceae bacterium]|nr:glycine zipper 2TM domain-containing protein [Helicobacteraceae bacterium]